MTDHSQDTLSLKTKPMVSVRLILSLATAALLSLAVIGVSGVAEHNARKVLHQELEARLLLEARHLALLSADALLADYPELTLVPVVREMQTNRTDLAFAVVLDHSGQILGCRDPRRVGQAWPLDESLVDISSKTELGENETLRGNPSLLVASVPVYHVSGGLVGTAMVGLNRSLLDTLVQAARQGQLLVTAAVLIIAILASFLITGRLLRPVDALRAGLKRIGQGDLKTPMKLRDRTELGLLAMSVNKMAEQLLAARKATEAKEEEILKTQTEVITTLGEVVESRSHETANHTVRVGQYTYYLALISGLDEAESRLLELAAPMHDIGKIGIPDAILNKPGKYTPAEHDIMKAHAKIGFQIFEGSPRELLQAAATIAHQHHEKWDGSGYPRGLAGEDIHIYGRIVAIADVFDALSFDRIYRKAMPTEQVLKIMREGHGKHFDPRLLDLFFENIYTFLAIKDMNESEPAKKIPFEAVVPPPEVINI